MWKMCAEFSRSLPEWIDGPFTNLDPDDVTQRMDTWYRGVMKVGRKPCHPPCFASSSIVTSCDLTCSPRHPTYFDLIGTLRHPQRFMTSSPRFLSECHPMTSYDIL